ncbi:RHS repeat-associated core domain-containing protein [Ostreibacterium oceani]|uniref:Teneurin-like YD-shell domain-containing protein n=1 Tax=Ostreibacterium oceani TaxID=2654998 RepID=A0A6N7F1K9_9GAMM|nr:RHS repeat-associated core domain-containing protein [Ostreibacterium oceani]MPV86678.1 hypothetical protein [Ostreibacterium oceani]
MFGNLRQVSLPSGDVIDYVIDPNNRRIGKTVNGQTTQKLLYIDQLNPMASLHPNQQVKQLYIYGERSHVPSAMETYDEQGNLTGKYRFITNHLGSVEAVVNTDTGVTAQQIDYDVWGNVLSDTNPNFQPFYFAGGLYDTDTKLTRFGARDYDAEIGRWTAKDPIGFAGGLTSLYDYVGGDPVNFIDPSGLEGMWDSIKDFFGGATSAATPGGAVVDTIGSTLTESRNQYLGYCQGYVNFRNGGGIPGDGPPRYNPTEFEKNFYDWADENYTEGDTADDLLDIHKR